MGGYMGKLLRVDLTSGNITEETLPDSTYRKYIGGVGLGARIIYDEVPPGVSSFDPENRLVFTTGPLTGTVVPASSDWTVTSIRAELQDRTILGSHSHGYWGAYLKMNGYDGIIVQGRASRPTYLWIHDGKAQLADAGPFWGMDTHDSEDAIKAKLGGDTSVATIGPAGENLVESASIENDKHHAASKGMGCIMGAKKLKAIAITRGPYGVPISRPQEFLQAALTWRNALSGRVGIANAGIPKGRYATMGRGYRIAGKNFTDPEWGMEYAVGIVEEAKKFQINPKGCWACPISCSYRSVVTTGPHAGYVATLAGGGENQEGSAGMAGVKEPGTVHYLTDMVDRLGMDSAPIGASLGVAFEAYEAGILTKEKTGGLELHWGDAEMVEKLWRMAVKKEGFGAILAQGPRATAEYIGEEALGMAVHVKGTSPNLHDWRPAPGLFLAQAVSVSGPSWQSGPAPEAPNPDVGNEKGMDPWKFEGKGQMVSKLQRRATFEDCQGVCWFAAGRDMAGSLTWFAQAIAAATGWTDFSVQEIMEVGERVMNLQKVYAMRRGLTKADDMDISPRILEPQKVGPTAGLSLAPYLKEGVEEFYEAMGWDRETGRPLPETLRRLGLQDIVKDLPPGGPRGRNRRPTES
ncbi:MAG: aldehyde ferredoxin oxidoreductase C-terminal domain-containing protein [Dehalococcoidia bacterium]|nr:aldehyde ferredoxin oxidoreductase C-terminal domain-containing protein [Dehalococcoidia bacterium]